MRLIDRTVDLIVVNRDQFCREVMYTLYKNIVLIPTILLQNEEYCHAHRPRDGGIPGTPGLPFGVNEESSGVNEESFAFVNERNMGMIGSAVQQKLVSCPHRARNVHVHCRVLKRAPDNPARPPKGVLY